MEADCTESRSPRRSLDSLPRLMPGLYGRWPTPVEATVDLELPFDEWPRLPVQLAECALLIARFARAMAERRGQARSPDVQGLRSG